ncbi:MAG TPA: Rho termination factor N-terminal domain-containing protein, partial [Chitinophagaceae bacterium]|nr:Rho termination factor N-terminal domain-containing protein [Chitinophagaceae bacterium]
MYDILQLNDMLVPELLDIAEQLNIPNVKKLDKQGLVYKILDSQAVAGSKGAPVAEDKGKRKRIIKTSTANSTEEAIVEDNSVPSTTSEKKILKKAGASQSARKEEKHPVKKGRKKPDE